MGNRGIWTSNEKWNFGLYISWHFHIDLLYLMEKFIFKHKIQFSLYLMHVEQLMQNDANMFASFNVSEIWGISPTKYPIVTLQVAEKN